MPLTATSHTPKKQQGSLGLLWPASHVGGAKMEPRRQVHQRHGSLCNKLPMRTRLYLDCCLPLVTQKHSNKAKMFRASKERSQRLLQLLLGAELVGVTALLLAAVGGARRKTSIALAADHLVAVVGGSEGLEGGLDDTTTQTEDEVEGRLLLDVVVREGAAVLELLTGEDKALLIRGDTLLVLDLLLNVVDGVRRLHLKGDRLTSKGLDEDLHRYTT
ncbi:hypothetical protein GQ54DRAFT_55794 [Martensiomyces pterosporus]|nr:hypothetical protein GQ54DRAFT_55794 [Martensiomyces pterosporus]